MKGFLWLLGVGGIAFPIFSAECMEENERRPLPSQIKRTGKLDRSVQPLGRFPQRPFNKPSPQLGIEGEKLPSSKQKPLPIRRAPGHAPQHPPPFGAGEQKVPTNKPMPLPIRRAPGHSSQSPAPFGAGVQDVAPSKPKPPLRNLQRQLKKEQVETRSAQKVSIDEIPNDKLVALLVSATTFRTPVILSDTILLSPKTVDSTVIEKVVTPEYCAAFEAYRKRVKESPDQTEEALADLFGDYNNKIIPPSSLSVFEGLIAVPARTVIENYEGDTVGKIRNQNPGKKVQGKIVHCAFLINDGKTTLEYPIKDGMDRIKLIPPTFPVSITLAERKGIED